MAERPMIRFRREGWKRSMPARSQERGKRHGARNRGAVIHLYSTVCLGGMPRASQTEQNNVFMVEGIIR